MRSSAEPVEGNVVRLSVELDEDEVDSMMADTFRTLSRQVRVPGFRPGKVPRRVLEARLGGAQAIRAEALREALPDFYARAVIQSEVDPIAPPEIDITSGTDEGPVVFDAVVQVRPTVSVPGYQGLRVEVPVTAVADDEVDRQVDRMRDTDAELVEVSRPAMDGDHVTIDVVGTTPDGTEVLRRDDFLYEVGQGAVGPELDVALRGSKPGDILTVDVRPDGEDSALSLRVLVKDVKEKRLPELTDEWVGESSDFETLAELRADIADRIGRTKVMQAQLALREGAVRALAELVDDDVVPEILVDEEVRQRLHDLGHRLEQQRATLEQFLEMTGQSPEDLLDQLRADAQPAVKADLALRAVADAEDLQVPDDELERELASMAERMEVPLARLRDELDRDGRTPAVRSDLRKQKAMRWLLDNVDLVDADGNPVARETLQLGGGDVEPDDDAGSEDSNEEDADREVHTEEVGL